MRKLTLLFASCWVKFGCARLTSPRVATPGDSVQAVYAAIQRRVVLKGNRDEARFPYGTIVRNG